MANKTLNLLVETQPNAVVSKQAGNSRLPIILQGVFMEAGKKNGNGRMYDIDDLVRAVDEFQPTIQEGKALAELEHPDTTTINPDRACARITSLARQDNKFMGEAVVLAADPTRGIVGTPCGTLLASLLQYGTKVGWSSRGVGDIGDDGTVRDFHLVTVDCVLNPSIGYMADSNATRFVDGVLESADFVINRHNGSELVFETLKKDIKSLPVDIIAKRQKIALALDRFLHSIAGI